MPLNKYLLKFAELFIYPIYFDEKNPRVNFQIRSIFSAFLMPLILVDMLALLFTGMSTNNIVDSFLYNYQLLLSIIDTIILISVYIGSRTKYYTIARFVFLSILFLNFFFIAIFPLSVGFSNDPLLRILFLLEIAFIIGIFSSFFYSIKTNIVITVILILTLMFFTLYTPLPSYITYLDMEILFVFWIAIISLIIVNSSLRDKYFNELEVQHKKTESGERHFKSLFHSSPLSLSLVDLSEIKRYTDMLHIVHGITDFTTYFNDHPEEANFCLSLIKIIDINPITLQLFKAKDQEELFLNLPTIVLSSNLHKHVFALIAKSLTSYETEAHLQALDNQPLDIFIKISVVKGFESSLERVIVAMVDITERKHAETILRTINTELLEKNALITDILTNIPMITFKTDKNLFIKEIDGFGLLTLHKKVDECINKPLTDLFPIPDNYAHDLAQGNIIRFDTKGITNDEQWFFTVHLIPSKVGTYKDGDPQQEGIIGLSLDVTEEKIAQERLIENENFAVLGSMVAGIAHEINNPLAYIKNNTERLVEYKMSINQLIQELLTLINKENPTLNSKTQNILQKFSWEYIDKDFSDILNDNLNGCDLIDKVVNDLRLYAYADEYAQDFKILDINDVILQSIRIISYKDKDRIEYKVTLVPNVKILGSRTKLAQVFLNLFKNSSQAIIGKGNILITSKIVNNFLKVKIWDNGQGIDPMLIKKLFKSFTTTKREGIGMGLGLSISKTIIEQHNGTISVQSELDKYTEFTIDLPLLIN